MYHQQTNAEYLLSVRSPGGEDQETVIPWDILPTSVERGVLRAGWLPLTVKNDMTKGGVQEQNDRTCPGGWFRPKKEDVWAETSGTS